MSKFKLILIAMLSGSVISLNSVSLKATPVPEKIEDEGDLTYRKILDLVSFYQPDERADFESTMKKLKCATSAPDHFLQLSIKKEIEFLIQPHLSYNTLMSILFSNLIEQNMLSLDYHPGLYATSLGLMKYYTQYSGPQTKLKEFIDFYTFHTNTRWPDLQILQSDINQGAVQKILHRNPDLKNHEILAILLEVKLISFLKYSQGYFNEEAGNGLKILLPRYLEFRNFLHSVTKEEEAKVFYDLLAHYTYPVLRELDQYVDRASFTKYFFITYNSEPSDFLKNYLQKIVLGLLIKNQRSAIPGNKIEWLEKILPAYSHMSRYPQYPSQGDIFEDYFELVSQNNPILKALQEEEEHELRIEYIFNIEENEALQKNNSAYMQDYLREAINTITSHKKYINDHNLRKKLICLNTAYIRFKFHTDSPALIHYLSNLYDIHAENLFPVLKDLKEIIAVDDVAEIILKKKPDSLFHWLAMTIKASAKKLKKKTNSVSLKKLREVIAYFEN